MVTLKSKPEVYRLLCKTPRQEFWSQKVIFK